MSGWSYLSAASAPSASTWLSRSIQRRTLLPARACQRSSNQSTWNVHSVVAWITPKNIERRRSAKVMMRPSLRISPSALSDPAARSSCTRRNSAD